MFTDLNVFLFSPPYSQLCSIHSDKCKFSPSVDDDLAQY